MNNEFGNLCILPETESSRRDIVNAVGIVGPCRSLNVASKGALTRTLKQQYSERSIPTIYFIIYILPIWPSQSRIILAYPLGTSHPSARPMSLSLAGIDAGARGNIPWHFTGPHNWLRKLINVLKGKQWMNLCMQDSEMVRGSAP